MPRFIDTHLHSWDRKRFSYPWLEGTELPFTFTPGDVQDPAADCIAAVFMEADRLPEQALKEAQWASTFMDHDPAIARVVAFAPIERGRSVADHLRALQSSVPLAGVRRLLQDEPQHFFEVSALVEGLREVGRFGLTFDACIRAAQLPALIDLSETAEQTTIVLDHLGKPETSEGWNSTTNRSWLRNIGRLAERPNVVVKLSGLAPDAAGFASLKPWVLAALDAFGSERAVMGSDWPVSRVPGVPYGEWFDFVLSECGLTPDEADLVGVVNASRLYGMGSAEGE